MKRGDPKSIFICPYSCRMGRWNIANTIIHELMHKCRFKSNDFSEMVPIDAEDKCIDLKYSISVVITVTP